MKKIVLEKLQAILGDKDFSEIVKGSSTSFFMKVAGLGCAQLFAFVVARFFGADAWGEFSLALSVITIGSILGTLGLDIGLLKLAAGNEKASDTSRLYQKSFFLTIGASLLITILVYLGAGKIATFVFSKPELTEAFEIASFAIIPFSLVKLNSQVLRGLKEITQYVFLSFVARYLFGLALLLLFIVLISGNNIVLISFITSLYLVFILSAYWLYNHGIIFSSQGNREGKKVSVDLLLKISLPLLLAGSLVFIKGWIDTIMVGIFLTSADVGIYNIALKLSGIMSIILTAVNTIAAPKFAEAYAKGNNKKLEEIVQHSTKLIFFTTIPLFILFIVFPNSILNIFGSEFGAGSTALVLLCIGNFVNALSGSVGYFMQMTGSHVAFQNITLIITVIGIVLNYFLIPVFGIEGAAISTCFGLVFWNLTCVIFIKYKYNIRTYFIPFLK